MIDITLKITKEEVYNEVAKTTAYAGAKMDDPVVYDRVFTTDEDQELLERFFNEGMSLLLNHIKRLVASVIFEDGALNVELRLSGLSGVATFQDSVHNSLVSFLTKYILSQWFAITSKDDAESYSAGAAGILGEIEQMLYYKKRPQRPSRKL